MRKQFVAAAVGGLVLLGMPAASWGQFQRDAGSTPSLGRGGAAGGGAGQGAASSGVPSLGGAAQVGSGDRFVRDSRQPGAFVGTDAAEAREFVGRVEAGTAAGQSGRRAAAGRGRAGQGRGRSRVTGRGEQFRTTLRPAFGYAAPAAADLTSALTLRLQNSSRIQAQAPLEVSVGGSTATLRGVVASSHDRSLAEQLVRLEPGVRQVNNELTIATGSGPAQASRPRSPSALPPLGASDGPDAGPPAPESGAQQPGAVEP